MRRIVENSKHLFERNLFGVCSKIGDVLGIATTKIRMYFIYATFLTLGSPIIFYLIAAFWLNIRKYIRARQHRLLD
jgi:phage shock protein PspC (stress-responsive transcriptional regulator)